MVFQLIEAHQETVKIVVAEKGLVHAKVGRAEYIVKKDNGCIVVWAKPGMKWYTSVFRSEESAVHYLCDHSLKAGSARRLVKAVSGAKEEQSV